MPTIETDTVSHVENSLKAYLKGGSQSGDLSQTITSSVKKALLENVEFTPAEKPASLQVETLRSKYISLNPSGAAPATVSNGNNHASNGIRDSGKQDDMPEPKVILYQPNRVKLNWPNPRRVGPGIQNMGNTCFMNSVLQCLTYTAPFANYILNGDHKSKCRQVGFCAFCEIGNHVMRALNGQENVIRPMVILKNLRYIAKEMSWGKQEDSHEFLRLLLDHIQKSCYKGIPNLDSLSKETTVVNQIFGGFLRSQVLCLKCHHRSSIYEPFLDLSLDIKNVINIQKALERFVQPDQLEGKNAYKCANCKNTVQAQKRFSIHRPPNVLTLQLKRFQFGGSIFGGSGKMTKHISFPQKLDLRPYLSVSKGEAIHYHLYAVICHSGYSCNSGHYFAFVCGPNKAWYIMNDSQVNQCQLGRVLSAEAYMLFYLKDTPNRQPPAKQVKIGPQLPTNPQGLAGADSKVSGSGSKGQFTSVGQKSPVSNTVPAETGKFTSSMPQASKILPASQRERVSFGIKLPHQQQQQPSGIEAGKPRIVMHIKSGKVVSLSPTKAEKTGKPDVSSPSKLVPYGDESDSEDDPGTALKDGQKNRDIMSKCSEVTDKQKMKKDELDSLKKTHTTPIMKSKEIHTDRVLNSPPKKQGTLRRSLSADGPLTVNTSTHHKLNATPGPWQVSDNSVAQSPSLASDCSNNSVNSTTEWNVMDKKEVPKTPVLPEAQYPGWTVISPSTKATVSSSKPVLPVNSADRPDASVGGILEKKNVKHLNDSRQSDKVNCPDYSDSPGQDLLRNQKQIPKSDLKSLIDPIGNKKLSQSISVAGKNINGCNHETLKENPKREGQHSESTCKEVVENSVDANEVHKQTLGFEGKRIYAQHDETERVVEDGEDSYQLNTNEKRRKKKKKKKKHKKHKYEDKEPLLKSSNSESEEEINLHSKKKSKYSHEHEASEFVWVEKTKESLGNGSKHRDRNESPGGGDYFGIDDKNNVWNRDNKNRTERMEKRYGHHGESYERREWHSDNGYSDYKHRNASDGQKRRTWDGSRSSSTVVNELKGNSVFGYGDKVQSWEGGRSTVDQEVEKDNALERKRRLEEYDPYEEELDTGRIKKMKRHQEHQSGRGYGHENPFQREQDYNNYSRDRWHSDPSSGDGHFRNKWSHGYKNDRYRSPGYDRPRYHSYHGSGDRQNVYKPYKKNYRNY